MNKLQVGLVQQSSTNDPEQNICNSLQKIRELASMGAKLIILPELHKHLYFCQTESPENFDLAESIPGPSTNRFTALAKELDLVLVISLFERRAAGLFHNTAVVIESDGSIAGTYRKMHIPDDPGYYEKFYFTPGDLGFQPIKTSIGKLGVQVCWDQWYPEGARLMALAGADILIYPTAIGFDPADSPDEQQRQLDAWINVQRGHAIANCIPLIAVNRVGFEEDPSGVTRGAKFWGNSFVAGCQGEFLQQCSQDKEENPIIELDMQRKEEIRRIWPFFRDRRIDAYQELLQRYRD